jgi:hypothetical protein
MNPLEQHRRWLNAFDQSVWATDIAALERIKALADRFPDHAKTQEYYQRRLAELKEKYPQFAKGLS